MKHIILSLFAAASLSASAQEVTTVARPATDGTNLNYVNFRAPLQKAPLLKLPTGQIKPEGWLGRYLELQRDGLNGKLGTVSAWLDKNNNQWLSDRGDHGWEEVPYWVRGYTSMAYILGERRLTTEAKYWLNAVLNNAKPNGLLGPDGYDGSSPDLWAKMPMLWALQTYYEATADERVLSVMEKYFLWELTIPDDIFLKGAWQPHRGGDNIWSVIWLYNRTGNEAILPLIDKLHRATSNWTLKGTLPNWHGVNVAQGFREPATYYIYNGDPAMLQATYDNQTEMRLRYGQMPGGMYAADENARHGYFDPRNGAETCAIVEQMASDEILMGLTADTYWADHCEDVAFNSLTAALTPDMKALRYITSANMAIADEKKHGPSIDNDLRGMLSYSPFSSRCCQHNHGMGWPYFSEHLFMATLDNGLAAMLYAANTATALVADGKQISIHEETNYPFDETISFTIQAAEEVAFPLYLRIPSWTQGATVSVNGQPTALGSSEGEYAKISRTWKDGDRVTLTLPMHISTRLWQQNKSSVSVDYGPLTLSLKIDENWDEHDSRDPAWSQDDSHWQAGVDASLWPSYALRANSPWNYGLALDADRLPLNLTVTRKPYPANNEPFRLENTPLEVTATGYQIPSWGFDSTGMTDQLPTKFVPHVPEPTTLTLVPMGAARLRISAFPRL